MILPAEAIAGVAGSLTMRLSTPPLLLLAAHLLHCALAPLWSEHTYRSAAPARARRLREYLRRPNRSSAALRTPSASLSSASPPLWQLERFLSEAECEFLVEAHAPALASCFPALLAEPIVQALGAWAAWGSRRSCQEFHGAVEQAEEGNALLDAIDARMDAMVARTRGRPRAVASEWQVVRYRRGGQFGLHRDENLAGHAVALSMMVYLNDAEGGETLFPMAEGGRGLSIRPRKGKLVVWSNCGEPHPTHPGVAAASEASAHRALPPTTGEKWILNKFYTQDELPCPAVPDFAASFRYVL
ncbi:hypothetical protein AB1Y20_016504 [Prymnesium parvum]|uniref:Fe2OG dioxygenase domain-containing protein n=1 Tax=Prymnesium parvum TaxID=97485 RepID=A0AB34IAU0_PRYPA